MGGKAVVKGPLGRGGAGAAAGGAGRTGTPNMGEGLCPWALEGPWAAGPCCTLHPSEGGLCSGVPPAPPWSGHSGQPRSQQQQLTSPTSLRLCRAVRRVGRSLCSASGQEVRAEAGWGGQAPPLALGRCPRCRRALESAGGWGPAVCPGLGSAHRWPHLTSVSGHPLLKPRPDALPGTWHCRQGQQWPVPLPNGRGAPARCLQPADEGGKATEAGEC